jgi:outer membrane protein TolC
MQLTLDEAVELALERNVSAVVAGLKVEEANSARNAARSGFLPQVNLGGTYTYLSYTPVISQPTLVGIDSITFEPIYEVMDLEFGYPHNFSLNLSVTQTLFTWGKLMNAYGLAGANVRAAELERLGAEEDVRSRTKEAYYTALLAERYLELVLEIQAELTAHYEAVEARYEAGLTSDLDLMLAEVQMNNVIPQLFQAEAGRDLAMDALKLTIGVPQGTDLELANELTFVDYTADLDSLIRVALEDRYDLRAMEERVDMLGKAAAIQRAGDKPTVFASWNYSYGKPYYFSDDWDGSWSATIGINIPLFDGFKAHALGREAGAQLSQLRHMREFQREMAVLEVTSAWKTLERAKESLKAQEDNVDLAQRTFEMYEEQYQNGFVSSLDVLDAEVMYSQARLGYISALGDYLIARAKLELAVKGGSSPDATSAGRTGSGGMTTPQGQEGTGAPSTGTGPSSLFF